jgi:glycosyltransferase involved in cell wall biosynthesis
MKKVPDLTIITPSLNDLCYLKRACASVADQEGADCEHLVVDGGSSDGTREWLESRRGIIPIFECVGGMYAALNAGIERASGTWVGFLNCDEQYLQGTLRAVLEFAAAHPHAALISGDFLAIRRDGTLICHRKETVPRTLYIRSVYLYTITCVLFIRRDVLTPDLRFDPRYRASGDEEFVLRLLERVRAQHLRRYLSAFVDRPGALSLTPIAAAETRALRGRDPLWRVLLRPFARGLRHCEKAAAGGYSSSRDLTYEVFIGEGTAVRTRFTVARAPWRWDRR